MGKLSREVDENIDSLAHLHLLVTDVSNSLQCH